MTPISIGRRCAPLLCSAAFLSTANAALAAGEHGGHDAEIGQPGSASAASRTISVIMYDNYYEPSSISVEAGETVRFAIDNKGEFLHEFNIGTATMHASHQAEMMAMFEHGMIELDRINHDMMNMDMGNGPMAHDDPNSVLLEPGESGEVIWTFPADARLEFACNIPGHYQVGMQGTVDINH